MSESSPGRNVFYVEFPLVEDRTNLNRAVVLDELPPAEGDFAELTSAVVDETRDEFKEVQYHHLRLERRDGQLLARYVGGAVLCEVDESDGKRGAGGQWMSDAYVVEEAYREEQDVDEGALMYGDMLVMNLASTIDTFGDGTSSLTQLRFGPVAQVSASAAKQYPAPPWSR